MGQQRCTGKKWRWIAMERQKNETAAAVTEAMRTRLQPYLFAERDTVYACVHSFGCQLNVSDGERIRGMLTELGYTMTDSYEKADLILFNTCAVRESAEDRVYGMLGNIKKYKKTNPNLILVLCGCMASEEHTAEFVRSHYPYVDIVFGTASLSRFPGLLLEHFQGKKFACDTGEYDAMYEGIVPSREHPFKASVPIMFGCNNFCTYCIVPYVRGRERSRDPEQILREVRQLVADGYKEIMLLGQNVNSYGKNLEEPITFAQLLQEVERVEGLERIRFMTSHPKDLSDELIEVMKHSKKICRHLHLPLQSGSTKILKAMNRRYTKEQYLELAEKIRKEIPDMAITTDIIVGFPGETKEDVDETIDVIRRVKYDNAFTFIYSKRTGTPAAAMEQVPEELVKEQFDRVLKTVQETAREQVSRYQGQTCDVLVEEINENDNSLVTGRMSNNTLVHFPGDASLVGKLVNVSLDECHGFYYMGHMVQS